MKGLLLMLACLWLGMAPTGAQSPLLEASNSMSIDALQSIAAPYFKTVPYSQSFSLFLQEILTDPDLHEKEVNRRTDSSFFYVSGTYQRFNPFIYRPTTLKLIIAEQEFTDSDTCSHRDTVVYCQLLVTTDTTVRGEQFVKKEYNRLLRKSSRQFNHDTYALGQANSASQGEVAHCFITPYAVSPLTLAWGRNNATREYVFSISLRLKVRANRAGMVTLPHEPIMAAKSE